MAAGTPYTRTLRRAMQALGGEEELAAELGVALAELRSWMSGEAKPPIRIFNAALDIVAHGRSPPSKDSGK